MSSTKNNIKNETSSAWGLDTSSLDEWLENDLRQSSLFNKRRNNTTDKCSLNHIITKETTLRQKTNDSISIKDKEEEEEEVQVKIEEAEKKLEQPLQNNSGNKSIPTHLIPLIKVYSLLNTIRQNELLANDKNHHASINQMYTPPAPPSPIMSINSDMEINNTNKKKRVNNRAPVDVVTKRQRNTDAARRSRLRKANKMETLEHKVDVLQKDNNRLRVKVAVLENDICHATEKDQRNRLRVLELEAQLALAHKQLVQEYENGE